MSAAVRGYDRAMSRETPDPAGVGDEASPDAPIRRRRVGGLDADQRRERRRQQILDAAKEQFTDYGYLGASIEQLSQAANVSTKSFYEVFSSREECYVALYQQLARSLQARMIESFRALPQDPLEASKAVIKGFVDALVADMRGSQILFGHARLIAPGVDELRRNNRRFAAESLEALWIQYGVPGENRAITVALIGGMFELIGNWLIAEEVSRSDVKTLKADLTRFYAVVRRGIDEDPARA